MNIYISSDHRGYEAEKEITNYLKEMNLNVINVKEDHYDTDDYVDYALLLGQNVAKDEGSIGILICGTGIGMSIAANKVKGIRAARCVDSNDAYYARNHNFANVLCLGVDKSLDINKDIIDTFINTSKPNEEKHLNRINKIIKYEESAYNEL